MEFIPQAARKNTQRATSAPSLYCDSGREWHEHRPAVKKRASSAPAILNSRQNPPSPTLSELWAEIGSDDDENEFVKISPEETLSIMRNNWESQRVFRSAPYSDIDDEPPTIDDVPSGGRFVLSWVARIMRESNAEQEVDVDDVIIM
jgi:hypothetical protein